MMGVEINWNYRIVQRRVGDEVSYQIHEVYYDESGLIEH